MKHLHSYPDILTFGGHQSAMFNRKTVAEVLQFNIMDFLVLSVMLIQSAL